MSERGFRFSLVDGAFILACAAAGWLLRGPLGTMVWIFPMAVGHFFLFCNVFRIRRRLELVWVGVFAVNMVAWQFVGFSWWGVLAVQTPVTVGFIAAEMRSPGYHGVFGDRMGV